MSIYSPIVTCTSVLTRSRLLFLPRRRLPVAWVCYAAGDMSWQLVDNAANGYVVDDQGSPSLAQGLHYTTYKESKILNSLVTRFKPILSFLIHYRP